MIITLVGAGAIGSLLACKLNAANHDVQLWTRHTPLNTLHFTDLSGNDSCHQFCSNDSEHLHNSELVIVAVKAFQLEGALEAITPHISTSASVLITHNGMGTAEVIKRHLPKHTVLFATTAQAALKTSIEAVRHTGEGETFLGYISHQSHQSKPNALIDLLANALNHCEWQGDIQKKQWQKLAINCAINPLTAIHNVPNGHLAQQCYQTQLSAIYHEVAMVMTKEGYSTSPSQLEKIVAAVIHATAKNYSSMNQDIRYQRQTEIDYISGYLVQRAEYHGIDAPVQRKLWERIKEMECSNKASS